MTEIPLAGGLNGRGREAVPHVLSRSFFGRALRAVARCVGGTRAVAVARIDLDGRLLHANRGFSDIVGARAAPAGTRERFFVHPTIEFLLERVRVTERGSVVYAGAVNVLGDHSTVRSLRATILRDGDSLLLIGERDAGGLERLAGTLLAMNEALTERGRELERLNRSLLAREAELARLAATDQLTELPNRRTLLARLRGELALSADRGRPLCVALADIDRFKSINDALGHEAGDAALVLTARTLCHGLRAGDLVGRWGGEEFLIVLAATTLDEAVAVVERLRGRLRQRSAEAFARTFTASFGVAQAVPGEDVALVVKRADAALYAAKAGGRNKVRAWRGEPDGSLAGVELRGSAA